MANGKNGLALVIGLGKSKKPPVTEEETEDAGLDPAVVGKSVLRAIESKDPAAVGKAIQQACAAYGGGEDMD